MHKEATDKEISRQFVNRLLQWNKAENQRQMPWKGEKDPYKIWLSEIILQQTRVEQGLAYYERFITKFPSVVALANAPENEVFKLWEGLGYYSRCRNLVFSAKDVSEKQNGVFPTDYASIRALKGIGDYTAAAIASFAYNLPYAVLDGNDFRVLARIFNIEVPIDSTVGKKQFAALAQSLLPSDHAASYNQAIMDFGATICKPVPLCAECFVRDKCRAYFLQKQNELPVKQKKIQVKERWFNYIVLQHNGTYAVNQRNENDIWQSLFEFPLVETDSKKPVTVILKTFQSNYELKPDELLVLNNSSFQKQRLSHQLIHFQFIQARVKKLTPVLEKFTWLSAEELKKYPFPKTLQAYLSNEV